MIVFTMVDISDIAFMRNTEDIIMPPKRVNCSFYWRKNTI